MWLRPRLSFLVLLSFNCGFSLALPLSQAQQAPDEIRAQSSGAASGAKTVTMPPDDSKYVGSDTCKTCHEDLYNSWAKTPHWKTTLDKKAHPPIRLRRLPRSRRRSRRGRRRQN